MMTDIDLRPWTAGYHTSRYDKEHGQLDLPIGTEVYTAAQVRELLRRRTERCAKAVENEHIGDSISAEMDNYEDGPYNAALRDAIGAIDNLPDEELT